MDCAVAKIAIGLFIALSGFVCLASASIKDDVKQIQSELLLETKQREVLSNQLNQETSTLSTGVGGLSAQITQLQTFVASVALVFAVASAFAALFINLSLRKNYKNLEQSTSRSQGLSDKLGEQIATVAGLQKDLDTQTKYLNQLKSDLEKNLESVFERLQEVETDKIFERLSRVPEDILNFNTQLATRTLALVRYEQFIKIYIENGIMKKLGEHTGTIQGCLAGILMQHFPIMFLADTRISDVIKNDGLSRYDGSAFRGERDFLVNSLYNFLTESAAEAEVDGRIEKIKALLNHMGLNEQTFNAFGGKTLWEKVHATSPIILNKVKALHANLTKYLEPQAQDARPT